MVKVPKMEYEERQGLAAFVDPINDDYRNRARNSEYHNGDMRYDYLRVTCAKTIAPVAFETASR